MRLVRSSLYFPVVRGLVATVREAKTTLHPGTSKAKIFPKRDFSRFHFIKLPISRRCLVRRRLTATRLESEASRMRRRSDDHHTEDSPITVQCEKLLGPSGAVPQCPGMP